jgi:zinc protease
MTRCGFIPRLAAPALAAIFAVFLIPAHGADAPAMPKKVVTVEGITEYRLENGCRVLLFPDPSSSKVTVNLTVFVGSRHEGYGETGMAHLLEHMVFKGTPTHADVPKALRDHGAQFNGTTSNDRTNYFETLNASDENLEFALKLEADRLVNSFVKREDLASEMTVVRNEFEQGENNPQRILNQRMMAAAYEWHNYGKSTIGNRSDIERVPIENLQAFYRKFYQPDNVMIVVAGNFKDDKALELVSKYFGSLKRPDRKLDDTYTEEPAQDGERVVTLRRVGTVGVVGAMYHIPAGCQDDFAALEVLTDVLDAEPSGRLYKALVETKKATGVNASAFGLHDPGVLDVTARVEKGASLDAVRDLLLETLEKFPSEKVTDEEVNRAKAKVAKQFELEISNSSRVGVAISNWAAQGDWRLFFLHRDRVAKVTPADVTRVAAKYLVPSNRTVGVFIPTDATQVVRADVPATPDVAEIVKDYKGGATVATGEFFEPTIANIEKRTQMSDLSTGVKAALLPKKTRGELVTIQLTLRYGDADSLKGFTTAAQMLAPMLTRGTKNHTRQQIEDELDRLKARINAIPGLGQVTFNVECKHEALPTVMGLLTEMLREPTFPAEEFDVLKRQRREFLEQGRTEPQILAGQALQRKLTPYAKDDVRYIPTIEEAMERLEATNLDQLNKLYADQLGGTAGEFVAVGDFEAPQVLKTIEDALKGWKAKTPYQRIDRPMIDGVKGETIVLNTPDKANAVYSAAMMLPVKEGDADDAALEIGDFLFGGGTLSSRLGNRVRQKEGLSYGVRSSYSSDAFEKSARFQMQAICNPKNIEKVNAAILDEVDKMLKDGVQDKEMDEAKKAFLAAQRNARGADGSLAGLLKQALYTGKALSWYADQEKKIEGLTATDATEAFKKYIDPKKLVIVEAGDFQKKGSEK